MPQQKLLNKVLSVLEENHIDYMVTGSVVSSLQGEPRATHDVDIVVNINSASVKKIHQAFPTPHYYISEAAIAEAIKNNSMFNLLDTTEGDKIDFWIFTSDAFDQSRFSRKVEETVLEMKMKISSPEDTILAKLRWAKLSGGSEKQFIDALRVYEIQFRNLDLSYLEIWSGKLQVNSLWKKIKEKAKPLL